VPVALSLPVQFLMVKVKCVCGLYFMVICFVNCCLCIAAAVEIAQVSGTANPVKEKLASLISG